MKQFFNKKYGLIVGVISVLLLIGIGVLLVVNSGSQKSQKSQKTKDTQTILDIDVSKTDGLTTDEFDVESQAESDEVFPYGKNETDRDEDETNRDEDETNRDEEETDDSDLDNDDMLDDGGDNSNNWGPIL